MTEREALELALETAKDGVAAIERAFKKPDDDWEPVLVLIGERGPGGEVGAEEAVTVTGIDPSFMASPEAKDILAYKVMPELIATTQAQAVAFISSAWYSEVNAITGEMPTDEQGNRLAPSQDPNRKEAVFIQGITAGEQVFAKAMIVRTDWAPPVLTAWDDHFSESATSHEGRFFTPLLEALRRVRNN